MITLNRFTRRIVTFSLAALLVAAPLANSSALGQKTRRTPAVTAPQPYSDALTAIEKAIDQKRQELGIPGLSLVIVKDDKVIYIKGLGVKDFEHKLPVTPDTLFAIGSASKAFTSMLDADAKITLRDLLSHRSGLNRTDLAMVTGKLNREELIQVAAMAKPTAKLGEKFQYQNVMYAAAGEAVARAQNSTWDKLIATRIFNPLGMRGSDTTVPAMQKARDYSFGYDYNPTTKITRRLPQRDITPAAPAGAINSNARDMAQWVRFMLSGGVVNGKRLVSEKNFNEAVTKQINIAGTVDYGFGWFLRQWNKHKVVEHGGNIDGFNSQVAFMPDQKLGFVLLTNVTASSLGSFAMNTIWKSLVGDPTASQDQQASGPATDPKLEVGKYQLVSASINFEVTMKDDKLILTVHGQPPYALQSLGARRYKFSDPAPAGFYATFRPIKGKESETELFLEQPQGNLVLPKQTSTESKASAGIDAGPLTPFVGSYESESSKQVIDISVREGKVCLVVPGQPPYPLTETEKNKLSSPGLPETYWIDIARDGDGNVAGIVLHQPEGRFSFRRLAKTGLIRTDDLIDKMITAYGGEQNMRKHTSSLTKVEIDMESQGVQAEGEISARAPNSTASDMTLKALGKQIGTIVSYFDGASGGEVISFGPEETYTGRRLEDIRLGADFYDVLNWKKNYKTIEVKRMGKVGDEEVYVVEKRGERGTPVIDYVSAKTFLLVKRDSVVVSDTTGVELPVTQSFSDYRMVDGVMVPFKMTSNNIANGDIVLRVADLKWDVAIPDAVFKKPIKN